MRALLRSRWLYVIPCILFLASAWTWSNQASQARRQNRAHDAPIGYPAGNADADLSKTEAEEEAEGAKALSDPSRYIQGDGFVEDAGTGMRLPAVPGLTPAEVFAAKRRVLNAGASSANAANAQKNGESSFPSDLRFGYGPRPNHVTIESLNVSSWVTAIGVDANRALLVPGRADVVGWWSGGFVPGESGPTVLVGHYDSTRRPGVFENLKNLHPGELVTVFQTDGSTYTYFVTEVEELKKTAFPTQRVYGRTRESTLRLITCGGKFDRSTGHYVDNTIVYAELLSFTPGVATTTSTSTTSSPTSTTSTRLTTGGVTSGTTIGTTIGTTLRLSGAASVGSASSSSLATSAPTPVTNPGGGGHSTSPTTTQHQTTLVIPGPEPAPATVDSVTSTLLPAQTTMDATTFPGIDAGP